MPVSISNITLLETLDYQTVAPGGRNFLGESAVEHMCLPIYKGVISGIPKCTFDYLIFTSDLQGHILENDEHRLLGEVLPAYLQMVMESYLHATEREKTCVLLCGDLYADTEKRGGLGDVREVWRAFREQFGTVVGVAGNHDSFGDKDEFAAFCREQNTHYLHRSCVTVGGIKMGGISGIIGSPDKPNRYEEQDQLQALSKLLSQQPDIVLLHQGPDFLEPARLGHAPIRTAIERGQPTLVAFGHVHWEEHVMQLQNGTTLLNTDGKCFILEVAR